MSSEGGETKQHTKKASSKKRTGPKYADMIADAIVALNRRGGASRQAIKAWILENYGKKINVTAFDTHFRLALRRGVKNGSLVQKEGTHRFRLSSKKKSVKKSKKSHKKKATKRHSKKKGSHSKKSSHSKKHKSHQSKKKSSKKSPKKHAKKHTKRHHSKRSASPSKAK